MNFNIDKKNYPTIIFLLSLIIFNVWMLTTKAQPWIISSLNIIFHEAGHWIFGIFGRTIGVLGGTLGELLVPSLFIFYFYSRYKTAGEIFGWWWLSTALYDISIYVADARAQVLPLIGGPGGHDWFYLLGRWRLLDSDQTISMIFVAGAWLTTFLMIYLFISYLRNLHGRIIS